MKAAILNDIHFGVHNANEIYSNHQEVFFSEVFFPYCQKNDIKNVFIFGDLYDNRTNLHVKSLYKSRKMFLEPLRDSGMQCEMILGNHDIFSNRVSNISSVKEVLGYFSSTIKIYTNPIEMTYDGTKVLWVPWINQSNAEKTKRIIKETDAKIVFSHFELNGYEFYPGIVAKINAAKEHIKVKDLEKFDAVYTGHYHHKSSKANIHYLGSQFQMKWNDYGSAKFFHVWDSENPSEISAIRNPNELYSHYHYDDSQYSNYTQYLKEHQDQFEKIFKAKFVKLFVVNRQTPAIFDQLLKFLNSESGAHDIKVIEREFIKDKNLDSLEGIEKPIKSMSNQELAHSYINEYYSEKEDVNTDTLKQMIDEIYSEAEELGA
jgi:hypothetical protein